MAMFWLRSTLQKILKAFFKTQIDLRKKLGSMLHKIRSKLQNNTLNKRHASKTHNIQNPLRSKLQNIFSFKVFRSMLQKLKLEKNGMHATE